MKKNGFKKVLGFAAHLNEEQADEQEKVSLPDTSEEQNALNYFFQSNPPADNYQEATDFLKTTDIYNRLWEQCGDVTFDMPWLVQWLRDKGYKSDQLDAVTQVWLVKQNP